VVALSTPESKPGIRANAVETLLLLDRYDQIPEGEFDWWFALRVEEQGTAETWPRQIAYLMSTRDGRDRLVEKLRAGQLPPELAEMVRAVVLQHLAATALHQRFDRIDREEHRELLEAMGG